MLQHSAPKTVEFGAYGYRSLKPGWYAYVGSAFGPDEFGRIDRPYRVADGTNDTRQWCIDYQLGVSETRVASAVRSPGIHAECRIARPIDAVPVAGVGAADRPCDSDLPFGLDRVALEGSIGAAHAAQS